MMKKQLNRMLQLANHTSGRSENSLLLSEDLIQFENRIEPARRATYNTHKKLQACLHGQQGSDLERRLKKMPLMALSQSMGESCRELDNESSIRKMLEVCCYIEGTLAKVCVDHELQLEKDVLDPLFKLSEEELPNILKHKKKLDKLTLDWTSAKNRLGQATKSVNTGATAPSTTTKVDLLKDEVEEIWRKVELSKDEYAADLYHFASKEEEYSNYFCLLLEAQAEYHRRSLKALDALLPALKTSPDSAAVIPENPAFGCPLKEHLEKRGQDIALPIEACVMMLLEKGMKEEGLFRLAPAASVLKRLKAALDGGSFDPEEFNSDSHAVAGALKSYLRELPQPLMTFDLYDEWFEAASEKDLPKQIERLREVCAKLPEEFYNNFRYLIKFLAKLAEYQEMNKMTPTNIAIVLGPNLLWPRNEETVSMMNMASASSVQVVLVIEPVIQNADGIFPEDLDFSVSGMFGPSSLYSSYTSTKKDVGSTEPAQTAPPPLKEVTALKEEGLCEERALVPPSPPPPDVEEGPGNVEAAPPSQTDPTSQTLNNPMKKVRKPVPPRPTFPPPQHPKASLPWTSKPMCPSLTQTTEERAIVRRATACPVRVPGVPPPPVPAPRTHQRTTSLGSARIQLGALPEAAGDCGKRPPEASVKTAPCQPRSPQVSWDKEPQPQPQPQAKARVRVFSASQAMLSGTNLKVKGSQSERRSGPREQSPDATTEGHL